jgi:uncharacterized protein (DUF433 family)
MTAVTPKNEQAPTERTEHPHVVRTPGVLGGKSRIEDTRISVGHVFVLYQDGGETAEQIAETYGLELGHVLDSLSYAYDHLDEMEQFKEQSKLRHILRANDLLFVPDGVGGRLIIRERLATENIPEGTPIYTWETLPAEYDR